MKMKRPYFTPISELVEVEMNGFLCQSSLATRDGAEGSSKLEDRQYGGAWGDDWN